VTVAPLPIPVAAIAMRSLTKLYGDRVAVDGMTLDVAPGELFGFLGPNGAGKTTTIKMLTGLLRPSHGVAAICGHDTVREASRARSLVGYCPDTPALYEKLTGREMLCLAADLYGVPREVQAARIGPMLDSFALGHGEELVQSYSRGMRQKLSLGCALLHDPQVLFLDEPTVGLDPAGARQLKDILRGLCDQGRTVFLSTHVLEVAELLCDRVGVVQAGRLVTVGTPAELREVGGDDSLEQAFLRITGGGGDSDLRPLLRALDA
jgi:ABC-2 type transport system ATP-binding protein